MFDGNGLLHPYNIGLASHAGVSLNVPSIGVAKSLLYGKVENNVVKINGEKCGYALISSKQATKPIYISPGHRISFESSVKIVKNLCKNKIPEPLRRAHILANRKIKD
jgi:deoxyribonuclease V